jgi:hypothetical protein
VAVEAVELKSEILVDQVEQVVAELDLKELIILELMV